MIGAELVAVDVRYAHAAHDQIRAIALEHRQRERAAGHGEDVGEAGLGQRGLHRGERRTIRVDHGDARHRRQAPAGAVTVSDSISWTKLASSTGLAT